MAMDPNETQAERKARIDRENRIEALPAGADRLDDFDLIQRAIANAFRLPAKYLGTGK